MDELPQRSPLRYSALSETGPVREDNQDSTWMPGDSYPDPGALFILADGMGGYAHGRDASEIAIRALFQQVTAALNGSSPNGDPLGLLRKGVYAANLAVLNEAARRGSPRMGTTLLAAWLLGDRLYLAHVGDSRAYLVRGGSGSCLTGDHSMAGDLLRAKVISADQVRGHARRSHLTRAVGIGMFVQPDLIQCPLQPGDRLILCTDGVWAVLEDAEIFQLSAGCERMDQLCRLLVDLAYQNDSDDNATVIAVDVRELPLAGGVAKKKGLIHRLMKK